MKISHVKRIHMRMGLLEKDTFIVPKNKTGETKTIVSPSGKYTLTIEQYTTLPGCWNFSRGIVKKESVILFDIKRNYGTFFYNFVIHSNGNEYLLCGEDYQGYNILNLTDGTNLAYLRPEARQGRGFCWIDANPSPDGTKILIKGCYWACPEEIVIYDFSDPTTVPLREIKRDYLCDLWSTNKIEWIDNNTIKISWINDIEEDETEDDIKSTTEMFNQQLEIVTKKEKGFVFTKISDSLAEIILKV